MTERRLVTVQGLVQGVGFRPFIYRLARSLGLHGSVANDSGGVMIEVQGAQAAIDTFVQAIPLQAPRLARIEQLRSSQIRCQQETGFVIKSGEVTTSRSTRVAPDLAPCGPCLEEMRNPESRRYRYAFINCTQCGPRFSIIAGLPYGRMLTSMRHFRMCNCCRDEYTDPANRRFHAEPIACADCGPQLESRSPDGTSRARGIAALDQVATALVDGRIVAIKGVGGFQLLVDAGNDSAVARLRQRKRRPAKPFALLYPEPALVQADCQVDSRELQLLCSTQRPIVLLAKKPEPVSQLATAVAPGNPDLGIMLPCSPVHYLLQDLVQRPLVATSGNLSGEPLCVDNDAALHRLGEIADLFLLHDRPILRPLDDSVVRVVNGSALLLRRARGYAPAPITLPATSPHGVDARVDHRDTSGSIDLLAVGAHTNNTVAVSRDNIVHLSQHIGDLDDRYSMDIFNSEISGLTNIFKINPRILVHDQHPGYNSTRWAASDGRERLAVQHHVAHFFACMADNGYRGPALGVSWDGTGYGDDGVIQGGEFHDWDGVHAVRHLASLRPFTLPGGEQAIREPRRQALGLIHAFAGSEAIAGLPTLRQQFSAGELRNLQRMLQQQVNTPACTSVGRLFDSVAALLGLSSCTSFQGEAAMALEFAAAGSSTTDYYPFTLESAGQRAEIDWGPLLSGLLEDCQKGVENSVIAARFHNSLAHVIVEVARRAGRKNVFLSGGVFQNRRLTETAALLLQENGYVAYQHRQVPPNDGGLALGQIYYARCLEAGLLTAPQRRVENSQCV